MRTAFDRALGTENGRAIPAGWTAPDGSFAFVLGSDPVGRRAKLVPGDHVEVSQSGTFGAGRVLRSRARIRPPVSAPGGDLRWFAELLVDGVRVTEREILADRTRTLSDLGWGVSSLPGAHRLAFRLSLRGSTVPAGDLEIPAFYVDAVTLDPSTVAVLVPVNRSPEPDETNVPVGSTVSLDVVSISVDPVSLADTKVYVGGLLAFSAGVFQSGFTGSYSTPQADTLRVLVDPVAAFASEAVVPVLVLSKTTGGASLDTSWSFTAEDVVPPVVVSAMSIEERVVRVEFGEPMAGSEVTTAASYTFERAIGTIAVQVSAVSVAAVSDRVFDVTLNQEITGGVSYTLTVSGARDVSGNAVAAPTNTTTFLGYLCPAPAERDFRYFDFFPGTNQEDDVSIGDLAKVSAVFDETTRLQLCKIDRFVEIIDPDVAPIGFVDAMLVDLGNPFRFLLSDVDKRRLVQVLVPLYKQKGTGPGIVNAIRFFLGLEVSIVAPGFGGPGLGDWLLGVDWILASTRTADRFTFWVVVPRTLTASEKVRISEIVAYMKRAEDHFAIIEPDAPPAILDHLELGLSELGETWILH